MEANRKIHIQGSEKEPGALNGRKTSTSRRFKQISVAATKEEDTQSKSRKITTRLDRAVMQQVWFAKGALLPKDDSWQFVEAKENLFLFMTCCLINHSLCNDMSYGSSHKPRSHTEIFTVCIHTTLIIGLVAYMDHVNIIRPPKMHLTKFSLLGETDHKLSIPSWVHQLPSAYFQPKKWGMQMLDSITK